MMVTVGRASSLSALDQGWGGETDGQEGGGLSRCGGGSSLQESSVLMRREQVSGCMCLGLI